MKANGIKWYGYVSMPFGEKGETNYNEFYEKAILPSLLTATDSNDIMLFREDSFKPVWDHTRIERITRFRGIQENHEIQLRQNIQDNIIASDFVVAVITDFNPNVMLEIGFAQAQKKPIIYLLRNDQFPKIPSNLTNQKMLVMYEAVDNLKLNLYLKIKEIIASMPVTPAGQLEHMNNYIEYFINRRAINLEEKFKTAKETIQILTTNLVTVSADYIDSIVEVVTQNPNLKVKILTSDPEDNRFIDPRADQLKADKTGYKEELHGSLVAISAELNKFPNCEVKTYVDFPVQLWHRIDDVIYVGQSSLVHRTRKNCAFGVSIYTPGVKYTFLDHFDSIWDDPVKTKSQKIKI